MSITNCNKCNKCKSTCGCKDDVLTTSLSCTFPPCDNPEKCSETFSTDCIIYDGAEIADAGIPKGANLTAIIQKLIGMIVNPGCNIPGGPCLSAIGFTQIYTSQTTAKFGWGEVIGATSYGVEYKKPTDPSWTVNPSVTTTFDTIGLLTSNTQYFVRVRTNCGSNSCYSDTLLIQTQ